MTSGSTEDKALFTAAWRKTRQYHGPFITFYLPGMIRYGNLRGRYPAVSVTGSHCELGCEHCKGRLLEPMPSVTGPDALIPFASRFSSQGALGLLLTGGANRSGALPWGRFESAIGEVNRRTRLFLSAHSGFVDEDQAQKLKGAGVRQALVDVMGDEETATEIYHLEGLFRVHSALEAIRKSGLELVPHIVAGLYYGGIRAEYRALELLRPYQPAALVVVVLTPLKGTPMERVSPPLPLEVARLIARARLTLPEIPIALGCERPRDQNGWNLERLAIRAGVNRMAVWSEPAVQEARRLGLIPRFQATCCSLPYRTRFSYQIEPGEIPASSTKTEVRRASGDSKR